MPMLDTLKTVTLLKSFSDLTISEWGVIATVIISALSLTQLWFIRKSNKKNMPSIVSSQFRTITNNDVISSKEITIVIVNPSQTGIVVKKIKVKKRFLGLFMKTVPYKELHPPSKSEAWVFNGVPVSYSSSPMYLLLRQNEYRIEFAPTIEESTYKISVKTSGGRCSTIYRPNDKNEEQ